MATKAKQASGASGITFEQLPNDRVRVSARWVNKGARYEVDGVVDAGKRRAEPFRHRFTLGGQNVFESSMDIGSSVVRTSFKFGPATTGARQLSLRSERVSRGSLVTGGADGLELLPVVSSGCSCDSELAAPRPILAWNDDGSTHPVTVRLKSNKGNDDLPGLVTAGQKSIALINNGGFGDHQDFPGDLIDWVFCVLDCVLGYLRCLLQSILTPGGNILIEVCSVIGGGPCIDLCSFTGSFLD